MSDFIPAITKTLIFEGGFTHEANGDPVNRGLTLGFLRGIGYLGTPPASGPATASETATIQGMSVSTAMALYKANIWDKQRCGEIEDQDVANKYFDLCVNQGPHQATLILQRACREQLPAITVDGIMGPQTIATVNIVEPVVLLKSIRAEAEKVYREIAVARPELEHRLEGWLARLSA